LGELPACPPQAGKPAGRHLTELIKL